MNPMINIRLEARNPSRNHFRYYEVEVDKDLFDYWNLSVTFGRIGQAGTMTRFSTLEETEILERLSNALNRRRSAFKRIACRYRLVRLDYSRGTTVEQWVPKLEMRDFGA